MRRDGGTKDLRGRNGLPTPVLALAPAQRGGLVARCGSLRRPAHHLFAGAVPGAGHPWGEPLRGGLSALGRRLLRRTAALPDTYESTGKKKVRKYELVAVTVTDLGLPIYIVITVVISTL